MKKNSFLWAALSMTAALVMTACSNDDNDMTEAPVAPSTSKTIPYTVTVGGDEATTRATVDADNQTLRFATGDKLYITGTNIQGVLDLQDGGAGETNNVTFSGELTYVGSGSPADNLALTATLVSAQQTVGTQVSVNTAGAVTVNYPTTAYCSSINDAVQKYSNLTGTSTYGAKSFTLTQQTAFLNFVITFEDATTTGTILSAVVSNNSAAICTANVTTTTESEKVVAKFVLPVAKGTTLSSANVKMGDKAAISFGASQTLTGKVYNVTKTQAAAVTTLNNTIKAWTAGSYAVPAGGLTYSDAITVSGDVTLVLTDGETLTLNKGISLAEGATLTIQGNGTMNVNGTNSSTASTVAGTGTLVLTSGTLTAKGGNGAGYGDNEMQTSGSRSAGGVAINGAVTVSGGTLTATGGAGGSIGSMNDDVTAGAGGAAISGSVTLSSGTLTATGGNGGNGGQFSDGNAGAGGAAIGGDLTVNGGTMTTTSGSNGVATGSPTAVNLGAGGKAVAGTVTDNR